MKLNKYLMCGSCFASSLLVSLSCAADQNVVGLLDDAVAIYMQKGDYFIKDRDVSKEMLILPSKVVEEKRGYIKTIQQGREIWLDQLDVTLSPPKSVGESGCISSNIGNVAKTGRGAGESCK